jgi:transcriptional regulator with XRE-family HTH domain
MKTSDKEHDPNNPNQQETESSPEGPGKTRTTPGTGSGLTGDPSLLESAARLTGGLASGALKEMLKRGEASLRWGSNLLLDSPLLNSLSPDRLEAMKQAGTALHDMRETAGLTLEDLSKALDMADTSLLRAVENGTATLSFDLVLRLASLLARNDPLPFIIRFARTYNPQLEKMLEGLGAGNLSRQIERERRFVNILRKRDGVRKLSDEQFQKVLEFSESAFNLAMGFVEENAPPPVGKRRASAPAASGKTPPKTKPGARVKKKATPRKKAGG